MYCNYSKEKFGGELTFIIPNWIPFIEKNYNVDDLKEDLPISIYIWLESMLRAELSYNSLTEDWSAQHARSILPNSLKTDLVMTGFVSDWKGFFKLRDAGSAHPQARELAKPLHEEFIILNYI